MADYFETMRSWRAIETPTVPERTPLETDVDTAYAEYIGNLEKSTSDLSDDNVMKDVLDSFLASRGEDPQSLSLPTPEKRLGLYKTLDLKPPPPSEGTLTLGSRSWYNDPEEGYNLLAPPMTYEEFLKRRYGLDLVDLFAGPPEPRSPDQPNLPEVISGSSEEPDGRPKSKGRMVRGIGSLMRRRIFPLIQAAQMGYDLLPEDKKFAGDFIDYLKKTKTHELFGMDKSGLDYFKDLFGMEQPEPEKSNESLLYDATTRAELFQELADQQRGTPEILMVEAQKVLGGGVLNSAIEHTGDLTHRIADKYDFFGGYGYDVGNKVDRVLRSLRSGYGFEKEFRENLRSNSRASGIPEERLRDLATEALQRYADAHKELRVYNEPQKWARDAAVALGEQRFSDAEKHLSKLQELIRGKGRTGEEDYMGTDVYQPSEDFRRANAEFDPQFEDLKAESPVEFTVARPQRKASGGFVDKPLYDDARVGGLI